MRSLKALLVFLISGLAVTGISFFDDKFWKVVFLVVGMLAYAIVGLLFSFGLLSGKEEGKEAYAAVFVLVLLAGYAVYQGLVRLYYWLFSWPLWVKVLLLSIIGASIIATIILVVLFRKKGEKPTQSETSN